MRFHKTKILLSPCMLIPSCTLQPDVEAESAVNLVQEVYELVADNYLDARSGGFDPQR